MMFGQYLSIQKIFKRPAMALIKLRVCADWSEPLLVVHTSLLQISCHVSTIIVIIFSFNISSLSL